MSDGGSGPRLQPGQSPDPALLGEWSVPDPPPPGSFGTADRRSRLLQGGRGVVVSTVSTIVFLGAVAAVFFLAPGAAAVRHDFFDWHVMWVSFIGDPKEGIFSVGKAFLLNIEMFLIAEVLILFFGMLIAIIRIQQTAVLFPVRMVAIAYCDVMRGIPVLLVILIVGFGFPALNLKVVSTQSLAVYGIITLTATYSAYVSEVFRAGLNAVAQSQEAAARSLGLTRWQSLRHVLVPQAVRIVIPPLLNDFISLQKDTALVSVIGAIEAVRAAEIASDVYFNYSSYIVAAVLFLLITVPLTRFTDHLIQRDRAKRLAGGTT